MPVAGLELAQWLEVLVVLSTADYIRHTIALARSLAVVSESKAGRIKPDSLPPTVVGRTISPIHGIATFLPPLIYVGALVHNGFHQPAWIARFALSTDPAWGPTLRIAACVASVAPRRLAESTLEHLGDQWHAIGRRERPRIVKTGPYAWVRHPGYSSVLLQEALWSIMFWSYVPLVALGITAAAFAVKMPIEESLILKDDVVRDEYRQYMKEVSARIVPRVW